MPYNPDMSSESRIRRMKEARGRGPMGAPLSPPVAPHAGDTPMRLDPQAGDEPMFIEPEPHEIPPSRLDTQEGRNDVLAAMSQEGASMLPYPSRGQNPFNPVDSDPYMSDSWGQVAAADAGQNKFLQGRIRTSPDWKQFKGKPRGAGG